MTTKTTNNAPDARLTTNSTAREGQRHAERITSMLDEWLTDESGYDEAIWPQLEDSLLHEDLAIRRFMLDE